MGVWTAFGRIIGFPRSAGAESPPPSSNTYIADEQWYLPALAGPLSMLPRCVGSASVRSALEVMERLSPDRYLEFVMDYYDAGLRKFGEDWHYADINTVLIGLSELLGPRDYLEIGVRRGRSMCMVAARSPRCRMVGFDMWIPDYAGMENPGESLVRSELQRIGHRGQVQFHEGDSRHTVPAFFRDHPDAYFDIITVDGDHTVAGARRDLMAVMPRLKAGGVLVFDDTCNQSHPGLMQLWEELVVRNPNFAAYTFNDVGFGVGFAVRKA